MIIKSFEINKIDTNKNNLILLYGNNNGLKNETISKLTKDENKIYYDEKEILDFNNNFFESILNKSLFEEKKTIIVRRGTEKLVKIIEQINSRKIEDIIIILADVLEKKSKLRTLFEKENNLICVPFYPDNDQTLSKLTYNFIKEKNIKISQSNINLIISKAQGDREKIINDLNKIENFTINGKNITDKNLSKLINLSENYSITELIDSCLTKNKKKIINILNENIYNQEDCIIISRTFLNKSKLILRLSLEYEKNKDINLTISNSRPPIFWKDKEIIKTQLKLWSLDDLKKLIYDIGEIELAIKQNFNNSLNIIKDFLLVTCSSKTNS